MKTLALVAALMIGTAAVAQDAATQPAGGDMQTMQQPQGAMPADQSAMPPANTGATPPADAGAAAPADPAMSSGQPMTPPADSGAMTPAPATDTGAAPAPMNSGMSGGMANAQGMQNVTPPPSTYPLCSRTVKDRCRNRGAK